MKDIKTNMISKIIEGFDWDKAFLDKIADERTFILGKTILSIPILRIFNIN